MSMTQFERLKKKSSINKSGLTLIELLIVITIIGLLAGVFVFNVSSWRARTRDSQRMADVRTIQQGLAMFFYESESSGNYPINDIYITGSDSLSAVLKSNNAMTAIPVDPINEGDYRYYYCSKETNCSALGAIGTGDPDGVSYILIYYLETNAISGRNQGRNIAIP